MFTSRPHAPIVGAATPGDSPKCRGAIESRFPRLAKELVQNWFRTGIDDLLNHLILDERGDRHGFPLEVIEELMFLADIRWHLTHPDKQQDMGLAADMEFLDYEPPSDHTLVWHSRPEPSASQFRMPAFSSKQLH